MRWIAEAVAARGRADVVAQSTRRISELVRAVKACSFMDRAAEQTVDLHEGLDNTLVIVAHRLKNVAVRREYDRTLPPVRAFGSGLNQVWIIFIHNAIAATDGEGAITIRSRRAGNEAVVEIADDGRGIPPGILSRISEPFFTTTPQGQGTGLGLDTAWRITEEHGGRLEVESAPGNTVFRVTLPLANERHRACIPETFPKFPIFPKFAAHQPRTPARAGAVRARLDPARIVRRAATRRLQRRRQ